MNSHQYARIWGAVMLAHAMGARIVGGLWGVEVVICPDPASFPRQLVENDEQLRYIPFKTTRRWASKASQGSDYYGRPLTHCMCPLAALMLCEQPPAEDSRDQSGAAAKALGVRYTLVDAFTCGWDGGKTWKGDATAQEVVPEMAAWWQAGARMREEYRLHVDAEVRARSRGDAMYLRAR